MPLKLNSSGGGSVTLDTPSTASNLTFTLPSATSKAAYADSSDNLQVNSGYGSYATGYVARAWVNFNGTGTVAIRASGNVSSITDNGTGDYTVNFTTAMPDTNYSPAFSTKFRDISGSAGAIYGEITDKVALSSAVQTGSLRIATTAGATYYDCILVGVSIFR